jgi:hypothetical protein
MNVELVLVLGGQDLQRPVGGNARNLCESTIIRPQMPQNKRIRITVAWQVLHFGGREKLVQRCLRGQNEKPVRLGKESSRAKIIQQIVARKRRTELGKFWGRTAKMTSK